MSKHSRRDTMYCQLRKAWLAVHRVCWVCGHGGADTVDHSPIPQRELSHEEKLDTSNWRAAHGVAGCPTCGRKCNYEAYSKPKGRLNRVTSKVW